MVTAAAWSPFFVAFAIGQTFTDKANSWIGLGIGAVTPSCLLWFLTTFKQGFFSCPSVICVRLSKTGDHAVGYRSGDGAGRH